jgi:hypothetical protein
MKLVAAGGKVTVQNKKGLTALMIAQLSKKNKALLDFLATSEVKEKIAEAKEARLLEEKMAQEAKAAEEAQAAGLGVQPAAAPVVTQAETVTEPVLSENIEKKDQS